MTIFTMKDGKIVPLAVITDGKSVSFEDFVKASAPAPAAAAPAPAADAKKDEPKKDEPKK